MLMQRVYFSESLYLALYIILLCACVHIIVGPDKLTIYYPHHEPFVIQIDLKNEDIETLKKKIFVMAKTCSVSEMKLRYEI